MRILRKGGGGWVTGLTPHVPAWEGKGKALDMDRLGYGGEGGEPQKYRIDFPKGGTKACPVEGCLGRAGTRTEMRVHFWRRHMRDIVIILEEGNLPHPRCPQCNMLVPWRALNGCHKNTEICRSGSEKNRRRLSEAEVRDSAEMAFEVSPSSSWPLPGFLPPPASRRPPPSRSSPDILTEGLSATAPCRPRREQLHKIPRFKYLRRILTEGDDDWP